MRASNIEFLRIFAIIGVFFLHFYNPIIGGAISSCSSPINEFILRVLECLFVCSVDLFVLISGYFLTQSHKRNYYKPIQLISQVILFSITYFGLLVFTSRTEFSVSGLLFAFLPQNWFVILYVVLYLCSPYLNMVIEHLSIKQYRNFVILLLILFSIYPTLVDVLGQWSSKEIKGMSTIGMYGSQYGYSVVQFFIMYFIGGYLARNPCLCSKRILVCGIVNLSVLVFWSYVDKNAHVEGEPNAYEYCNPLVIFESVILLVSFLKIKLRSNCINELSRACFTMYLLHSFAYSFVDIKTIVNFSPASMLLSIAGLGIVTYLCCYFIYKIYVYLTNPFWKYFKTKWAGEMIV